jgi:8-oxo-dGTP pyrophosphatase MutT (NUDIX family)
MNQPTEYVGVILQNDRGWIAMQLREKTRELNPDRWSLFGGHIEQNEEHLNAASREIKEELSVALDEKKLKFLGRYERENQVYHIFHYLVTHELDVAVLKEGVGWRWCSPEEIRNGEVEGKEIVEYHARFLVQFFEGRSKG